MFPADSSKVHSGTVLFQTAEGLVKTCLFKRFHFTVSGETLRGCFMGIVNAGIHVESSGINDHGKLPESQKIKKGYAFDARLIDSSVLSLYGKLLLLFFPFPQGNIFGLRIYSRSQTYSVKIHMNSIRGNYKRLLDIVTVGYNFSPVEMFPAEMLIITEIEPSHYEKNNIGKQQQKIGPEKEEIYLSQVTAGK